MAKTIRTKKKARAKAKGTRARSAETGQFVSDATARRRPKTTVREKRR